MQRSRIFKQWSRCCGAGIGLSLMGAQEQFHIKSISFFIVLVINEKMLKFQQVVLEK